MRFRKMFAVLACTAVFGLVVGTPAVNAGHLGAACCHGSYGMCDSCHSDACCPKTTVVKTFTHPYTCCPVEVEICVPACGGRPEVDCDRDEIEYEWDCCDWEVEIKFRRNGCVEVDYDD